MITLFVMLSFYLESPRSISANAPMCCSERHIATVIVQEFEHIGGNNSNDGSSKPDLWCRINSLPDPTCAEKIEYTADNRKKYKNGGSDKIKIVYELPENQQKHKILFTIIDDDKRGGLKQHQVRNASQYFYNHKKYNYDIAAAEIWQDMIEFNITSPSAPDQLVVKRTINAKGITGLDITLTYLVHINVEITNKDCTSAKLQQSTLLTKTVITTMSTSSMIQSKPTISSLPITKSDGTTEKYTTRTTIDPSTSATNRSTFVETWPINLDTSRAITLITTQPTYQAGIIIKLELETIVEDSLLELERSEEGKVRHKCSTLAKLVGCTRCMIEIQKLQKTHLPIKLSRPSHTRRVKRQGTSISSLRRAIRSFFHAVPQDIRLFPFGSARIVGRKDSPPEETSKDDTTLILMIIFVVIAIILLIVLLLVLLYWIKTRTNKETVQQLKEDPEPIENGIEIESTTMTDIQDILTDLEDKMESGTIEEASPSLKIITTVNASGTTTQTKDTKDGLSITKDITNTNKRMLTKEEETIYASASASLSTGTESTKSASETTTKDSSKATYPILAAAIEKLNVQSTTQYTENEPKQVVIRVSGNNKM